VPLQIGGLGADSTNEATAPRQPGFAISVFTMLLPVLLMLMASAADIAFPTKLPTDAIHPVRQWADFLGAPTVAMLIAVLVSFWTFGKNCGLTGAQILKFSEVCLAPAAGILLIIAAGGGFSKVLDASGVGAAIGEVGKSLKLSPLLLGWIIAGLLRIAVGSATVAVTTAATLMVPIIQGDPSVNKELLVLSLGAGSLIMSHVNDSGFWLMKEYLGMSVQQTLKTWTVVETGIATVSIAIILLVNAVI
jgi:GntP family gluconate:H+ symporter